jgi:hypothetical protein
MTPTFYSVAWSSDRHNIITTSVLYRISPPRGYAYIIERQNIQVQCIYFCVLFVKYTLLKGLTLFFLLIQTDFEGIRKIESSIGTLHILLQQKLMITN